MKHHVLTKIENNEMCSLSNESLLDDLITCLNIDIMINNSFFSFLESGVLDKCRSSENVFYKCVVDWYGLGAYSFFPLSAVLCEVRCANLEQRHTIKIY